MASTGLIDSGKVAALAVLGLLLSVGYWQAAFIWDDVEIFAHVNQTPWLQLWFEPVTGGRLGGGYYRPLAMSVLKLCAAPYWAHIAAMICHGLSAVAVSLLLDKRAVWCTLIFLVHPLSNEILGWASALPDALALCLGLWAALSFARRRWGLVFVFLILGALSKETAWVPLFAMLICAPKNSARQKGGWIFGGAFGLVLLLRLLSGVSGGWSIGTKLLLLPNALTWALSMLLWPWPLSIVHDLHVVSWSVILLGGFAAVGLIGVLWWPRLRFGALMILLSIALAMPTTIDGGLLGERYCYMATAGLALLLGELYTTLEGNRRQIANGALGLLVAGAVFMHTQRMGDWVSDSLLFGAAAQAYPESSYAHHFEGVVALHSGDPQRAAVAFERALQFSYAHVSDRKLYLMSLVESERFAEAVAFAEEGAQSGLDAEYLAYWAKAYFNNGQKDAALQLLTMLCPKQNACDGPEWVQDLYVTALKE